MDLVADYAAQVGVGREIALDETLPWIIHTLHRAEARAARRTQVLARTINLAVAPTAGCEGAARALDSFQEELQAIIDHDPFAQPESGPTRAEIAAFERLTRGAR